MLVVMVTDDISGPLALPAVIQVSHGGGTNCVDGLVISQKCCPDVQSSMYRLHFGCTGYTLDVLSLGTEL
jgi:hypothetical protein